MHDPTKVLLGATRSSFKTVDNELGVVEAGLAVVQESAAIGTTLASGSLKGVSLGKSMSDTSRTAICRRGTGVPIQLHTAFTPVLGGQVLLHATNGKAVESAGTGVNAIYASGKLSGVKEDGTSCDVAYIDFAGGL